MLCCCCQVVTAFNRAWSAGHGAHPTLMPRAWTARATHWLYRSYSTGIRTGGSVPLPLVRGGQSCPSAHDRAASHMSDCCPVAGAMLTALGHCTQHYRCGRRWLTESFAVRRKPVFSCIQFAASSSARGSESSKDTADSASNHWQAGSIVTGLAGSSSARRKRQVCTSSSSEGTNAPGMLQCCLVQCHLSAETQRRSGSTAVGESLRSALPSSATLFA